MKSYPVGRQSTSLHILNTVQFTHMNDNETLELMQQQAKIKPIPVRYCQSDSGEILYYFYGGMGECNTYPVNPERAESIVRLIKAGQLELSKEFSTSAYPSGGLCLLQIRAI